MEEPGGSANSCNCVYTNQKNYRQKKVEEVLASMMGFSNKKVKIGIAMRKAYQDCVNDVIMKGPPFCMVCGEEADYRSMSTMVRCPRNPKHIWHGKCTTLKANQCPICKLLY